MNNPSVLMPDVLWRRDKGCNPNSPLKWKKASQVSGWSTRRHRVKNSTPTWIPPSILQGRWKEEVS